MTTLETTPTTLPRRAALIAALGLLAMAVIAAPVNFLIVEPLLTAGDTAAIADAVAEAGPLLWWGVAGFLAVAVLDVVVAGALWHFFRPVAEGLARAAALLRVVYAAIFIAAIAALESVSGVERK